MVSPPEFGVRYSMQPRDLASSRLAVINCTKFAERLTSLDGKSFFYMFQLAAFTIDV